jgi:gliding motility-associated lipoprotein GldH
MKKLLRNSILLIVLLSWISCNDGHKVIYHDYHSISTNGWKRNDTLIYKIYPTDSMQIVRLYAEVRNSLKYPYSDLFLVVKQNLADSLKWQTDTVKFQLADNIGRWTGIGWGNYYQSTQFVKVIRLPSHPFHATIRVSQEMKDNVLKGITDVGFRIEYP